MSYQLRKIVRAHTIICVLSGKKNTQTTNLKRKPNQYLYKFKFVVSNNEMPVLLFQTNTATEIYLFTNIH